MTLLLNGQRFVCMQAIDCCKLNPVSLHFGLSGGGKNITGCRGAEMAVQYLGRVSELKAGIRGRAGQIHSNGMSHTTLLHGEGGDTK